MSLSDEHYALIERLMNDTRRVQEEEHAKVEPRLVAPLEVTEVERQQILMRASAAAIRALGDAHREHQEREMDYVRSGVRSEMSLRMESVYSIRACHEAPRSYMDPIKLQTVELPPRPAAWLQRVAEQHLARLDHEHREQLHQKAESTCFSASLLATDLRESLMWRFAAVLCKRNARIDESVRVLREIFERNQRALAEAGGQ